MVVVAGVDPHARNWNVLTPTWSSRWMMVSPTWRLTTLTGLVQTLATINGRRHLKTSRRPIGRRLMRQITRRTSPSVMNRIQHRLIRVQRRTLMKLPFISAAPHLERRDDEFAYARRRKPRSAARTIVVEHA